MQSQHHFAPLPFLVTQDFEEIKLYDPQGNLIDTVNYASSTESLSWSLVDNVWQYRLPTPNEKNPKGEVEMVSDLKKKFSKMEQDVGD